MLHERTPPLVISASRRTDLVACYPDYLLEKLQGHPPEKVHTIVIWTKNPVNMIKQGSLKSTLQRYAQLYVHLTITGLGGTPLEPNIPKWDLVAEMIPRLVEMVKGAERVAWRFDPLIVAETERVAYTNTHLFPIMAQSVKNFGITTCRTSWVSVYKKVIGRMKKKGFTLKTLSYEECKAQAARMEEIAGDLGMTLQYCCMEGFKRSRCIDGELLSRLHPDGLACSTKRAKGQRRLCGCTESVDIGWYSLKCRHGCLYCYAEPLCT